MVVLMSHGDVLRHKHTQRVDSTVDPGDSPTEIYCYSRKTPRRMGMIWQPSLLQGDAIKAHPQNRMGMILIAHLEYLNGPHFAVDWTFVSHQIQMLKLYPLNVMVFGAKTLVLRFRRGHKGGVPVMGSVPLGKEKDTGDPSLCVCTKERPREGIARRRALSKTLIIPVPWSQTSCLPDHEK